MGKGARIRRLREEQRQRVLAGPTLLDICRLGGRAQVEPANAALLPSIVETMLAAGTGEITLDNAARCLRRQAPFPDRAQRLADPFNNPFTIGAPSNDQSRVAFPGNDGSCGTVLSTLLVAATTLDPPSRGLARSSMALTRHALMLVDEVASRLGLQRGEEPLENERLTPVPDVSPVVFTLRELIEEMGPDAELVFSFLASTKAPLDVERPIFLAGNEVVLSFPHLMLPAISRSILRLASAYDVASQLASRAKEISLQKFRNACEILDVEIKEEMQGDDGSLVSVLEWDVSGAFIVSHCFDSLDSVEPTKVGAVDYAGPSSGLLARAREVASGYDECFEMTVIHDLSREATDDFESDALTTFRLHDIEVLAFLEDGRQLANYFRQLARIRAATTLWAFDAMDAYYMYRSSDHQFRVRSHGKHTLVMPPVDGGGELRREYAERYDQHTALLSPTEGMTQVRRLLRDKNVPLYGYGPDSRLAVMAEVGDNQFWVRAASPPAGSWQYQIQWTVNQGIAYWIWQLHTSGAFQAPDPHIVPFSVEVSIRSPEAWGPDATSVDGDSAVEVRQIEERRIACALGPEWGRRLMSPDNQAERDLVRELARILSSAPIEGPELDDLVDEVAPLGPKKNCLLATPSDTEISISSKGVPRFEAIRDYAVAAAQATSDDVIEIEVGERVDGEAAASAVNRMVAAELKSLLAEIEVLDFRTALKAVLLAVEASIHHENHSRFNLTPRMACYGGADRIKEELVKSIPDGATASLAQRFLLDVVATTQPTGSIELGRHRHDMLAGIASDIVHKGMFSDNLHYRLTDAFLIGTDDGPSLRVDLAFNDGHREFMTEHVREVVSASAERFVSSWDDNVDRSPLEDPLIVQLRQASEAEFGGPDFVHAGTLLKTAALWAFHNADDCVAEMSRAEFCKEFSWDEVDESTVAALLDRFSLSARSSFLKPPAGVDKEDLYPWRFNRSYSSIRRPFILVGDSVIWSARLTMAAGAVLTRDLTRGTFKTRCRDLKEAMGALQLRDATNFNDEVARHLEGRGWRCLVRRTKFGGIHVTRPNGDALGDVDVLAYNADRDELLVIDAKRLRPAGVPHQVEREFSDTFDGANPKSSASKHRERTQWIEANLQTVMTEMGDPESAPDVVGLIVTSDTLVTPYILDCPVGVVSLDGLDGWIHARST